MPMLVPPATDMRSRAKATQIAHAETTTSPALFLPIPPSIEIPTAMVAKYQIVKGFILCSKTTRERLGDFPINKRSRPTGNRFGNIREALLRSPNRSRMKFTHSPTRNIIPQCDTREKTILYVNLFCALSNIEKK